MLPLSRIYIRRLNTPKRLANYSRRVRADDTSVERISIKRLSGIADYAAFVQSVRRQLNIPLPPPKTKTKTPDPTSDPKTDPSARIVRIIPFGRYSTRFTFFLDKDGTRMLLWELLGENGQLKHSMELPDVVDEKGESQVEALTRLGIEVGRRLAFHVVKLRLNFMLFRLFIRGLVTTIIQLNNAHF